MKRLLNWLSRRRFPYEPLITVEISRSRLLHNLNEFRKIAPRGCVAPVLKSNAYGHGLFEVARILEKERKHIPFFVVDSYFEAVALRANRIKTPLLIIGYTRPETIMASRLRDTSFTISNIEVLNRISKVERDIFIQLKIDTGMRRQGIMPEEIDSAIAVIQNNPYLMLEGISSHLSDADNADPSFTESQIALWEKVVKKFRHFFPKLRYVHLSNTDGHRFSADTEANVSRLGLGLYGIAYGDSFSPPLDLLPVMEMRTILTGTKKIARGDSIGYGRTFTAEKDMVIATVPAGYYEGVDRRLSNKGMMLVGPERIPCPIVGRVSMNISTIDVSGVEGAGVESPVVVISRNQADPNSVAEIAKICGMIGYEIAVYVPAHLKREVVD